MTTNTLLIKVLIFEMATGFRIRRQRLPKKIRIALLTIGLLMFAATQFWDFHFPASEIAPSIATNRYAVVEVSDGDTIKINMDGKVEEIRFVGVDTPETRDPRKAVQCYGKAATQFTKSKLEGKQVRLEADTLGTNRDRYDRLLRYVYVDDILVNAEIVKQGYGFANTGFPFSKMEEFKQYQRKAEMSKQGLWGDCQVYTKDSGQQQTNDD